MKLIDDDEELQLIKQQKYEQRDTVMEDFAKKIVFEKRELEVIRSNAKKAVDETNAMGRAEQAQIIADSDLKKQEIDGDTLVTKTRDETKGLSEAELIEIQAKNESEKKIATKMREIASKKSDTIEIMANGEG